MKDKNGTRRSEIRISIENLKGYKMDFKSYYKLVNYKVRTLGVFLILFCLAGSLNAQVTKGVSIGGENAVPDPSAMLDIQSSSKGLLIPRLNHEAMLKITPVSDGLMVYVKDSGEKNGVWVWNSLAKGWIQLKKEDNRKEIFTPVKAIVMYCGSFYDEKGNRLFDATGKGTDNTKMKGWRLCNGNGGTPDLRGRFVMGANPAEGIGPGSGGAKNLIQLTEINMPLHNHKGKILPGEAGVSDHTHSIEETEHTHSTTIVKKNKAASKGDSNSPIEMAKGPDRDRIDENTSIENITSGQNPLKAVPKSAVFGMKSSNQDVDIQYPDGFIKSNGGSQPIDNRPSYFVVAFIIKMN